jgi:molybdate transport system ATP-binding protein
MPDNVKAVEKDALLTVRLRQQFGSFHLDVDFQVPPGLIVLFGFSGAGKSLTLRSMAGLLHPKQGYVAIGEHVLFDSEAGIDLPSQERHVGYVPQHYALFPHLTVAQNISFALPKQASRKGWLRGRQEREAQHARIDELLGALELKGLERQYPATLSGGQQQRVALARALAAQPRLLLLDEPFNALDIAVRQRLRDSLKRFQRHFGIPIVLVTHDHDEAQQLADTVVALQHGRVEQVGRVQDIFFAPRTPDVARLVGQQNIFGGYVASPAGEQQDSTVLALRLDWLQSEMQTQLLVPQGNASDRCWLPLPDAAPLSVSSSQTLISGCIRNDEVLVHRLSGNATPAVWTAHGVVQWVVELLEAQMHGASVRLLVRPCWTKQLAKEQAAIRSMLEIYISRLRWQEIEVMPGELLLLEIGSEAIHCFEVSS